MNTSLAMTNPIAIAPKGRIGFVQSGLAGKKELVFRDTAALMKHRLQEKTQN